MSETNMTFPLPFVERINSEADGFPHTIEFGIDEDEHLGVKRDNGELVNIFDQIKDQLEDYLKETLIDEMYPVGSVFITIGALPSWLSANGRQWQKVDSGKCLMSSGSHPDGTYTAGTVLGAGAPNSYGRVGRFQRDYNGNHNFQEGATWNSDGLTGSTDSGGGSDQCCAITFSLASGEQHKNSAGKTVYSNTIYGKSETIKPPSYVVDVWKRIS